MLRSPSFSSLELYKTAKARSLLFRRETHLLSSSLPRFQASRILFFFTGPPKVRSLYFVAWPLLCTHIKAAAAHWEGKAGLWKRARERSAEQWEREKLGEKFANKEGGETGGGDRVKKGAHWDFGLCRERVEKKFDNFSFFWNGESFEKKDLQECEF